METKSSLNLYNVNTNKVDCSINAFCQVQYLIYFFEMNKKKNYYYNKLIIRCYFYFQIAFINKKFNGVK